MDRQTSANEMKPKANLDAGSTERERWDRHAESLLSMLGYAVGLGNIWRFPYLVMRNGGGAFLIPFAIFLLICGIPVYFLEVASGQFSGKGIVELYDACPLLRGVGIGICLTSAMSMGYYSMILGYTVYYLANSFKSPLPWTLCKQSWNTDGCFTIQKPPVVNESLRLPLNVSGPGHHLILTNESKTTTNTSISYISSAEEFWQENVLHMSEGIHQLGSMQWYIAFCQLAAWVIAFLCVIKGIKSSGKAVYVTATLPYILLTVLLIRGLTLPGSVDGILFYITPDFTRLKDFQVWIEAAVQVFYSVGIVWGPLVTLGSYNKFKNNCLRDSIILCIGGELTSVFGGLVVFAILGVMADKRGVTVDKVAKSGPGLAFIAYPEAISMLPVPNLWAVIFFLMLLTVGLDSVFGVVETVLTTFADRYKFFRNRRVLLAAIVVCLMYLHNLIFCTEGGIYAFQLFDFIFTGWNIRFPADRLYIYRVEYTLSSCSTLYLQGGIYAFQLFDFIFTGWNIRFPAVRLYIYRVEYTLSS
ncbi:sodium- and chloride-dependent GABA transporter 3-like isoform X2 [Ostrea edulis]|uniref:sodium- and chloride-dependent GABA transporter 3-like isoform X2 n=1 Tax=Ostrea edulis TaxID=37623 RepID=UPI0024AEFDDA|nr:sodium- and chloride-dependent GABA transporter 3-like isoform X2 [Ostrea edulis]